MSWLPPIVDGSRMWLLPLAALTQQRLVTALITTDDTIAHLSTTLRNDPAFTSWSLLQLRDRDAQDLQTVDGIAQQLQGDLVRLLLPAANVGVRADEQAARRLAASSLHVAREAAARCTLAEDRSRVELLGLVHNAYDWLKLATPDDCDLLPTWLTEQLESLRGQATNDPVALAVRFVVDTENGTHDVDADSAWTLAESKVLSSLAERLQRVAAIESRFDEQLETEKLASLQQFAYGLSHEINNPLANIATRAQTLMRDESDPERLRKLTSINVQAFRAHEMIADVMLFAKPPTIDPMSLNVSQLIAGVVTELQSEADEQATALNVHATAGLTLIADKDHLAVAIRAVCLNSLQALRHGGSIDIAAVATTSAPEPLAPGNWIKLSVHDTGPGIPPDVRRHLFDPYFSGREAGRGLGVGLSKCWRVVQLHGGKIEVESSEDEGTKFTIYLPATPL